MTKNGTLPAFARPYSQDEYTADYPQAVRQQTGLTKLEYFTAAALTGVLAADPAGDLKPEAAARIAVKAARAALAELDREAQ